MQISNN